MKKSNFPNRGNPIKIGELANNGVFLMRGTKADLRTLNFLTDLAVILRATKNAKLISSKSGCKILAEATEKTVKEIRRCARMNKIKGLRITKCSLNENHNRILRSLPL